MNYYYILWAFVGVIVYKLVKNITCFFRIKSLDKKHMHWLVSKGGTDFYTYKSECIKLFKGASVKDSHVPTAQPMGYMQIATFKSSFYQNFPNLSADHAALSVNKFSEAMGEYRRRIFETFNPLYWIDTILFLPRNLLDYLGLDKDKSSYKLLNVTFTVIWWCIGVVFAFLNEQIKIVIINLLEVSP